MTTTQITSNLFDVLISKLIVLLFTGFFAASSLAEVDLLTIDSFFINSMGENSLMVTKKDDTAQGDNGFFFLMERPFCVCERVTFVQQTPQREDFKRPKEDSYFFGSMKIDHKKPKNVRYKVILAMPEKSTNLIEPLHFPSIREAKFMEINTVYGKSRFNMDGFSEAMKQATKICESFIPYKKVEAKEMDT